ncbi:hypothetical protein [Actinomadura oligospora]|uniref:hypothetical protein n=1 Tax=Actinomadura oligospora TaxID=111804 RepID=UPI00047EC26D|nr:hypothetical protein [Actinomadura oligospora]
MMTTGTTTLVLKGALVLGCAACALSAAGAASASVGDFTYREGMTPQRLHNAPDGPCHSLRERGTKFSNRTGTTVEIFKRPKCKGRHQYVEPHAGTEGAPPYAWSFRFMP